MFVKAGGATCWENPPGLLVKCVPIPTGILILPGIILFRPLAGYTESALFSVSGVLDVSVLKNLVFQDLNHLKDH